MAYIKERGNNNYFVRVCHKLLSSTNCNMAADFSAALFCVSNFDFTESQTPLSFP